MIESRIIGVGRSYAVNATVYNRYGGITREILREVNDPLEVFDDTYIEENVQHFVVYILWLKGQTHSFEKYLHVRERRFKLWRQCVYKLWRL